MRTIELAYALCLVSPWMHNRSVTRAGATSSYKLVAETVLVVAILRALMLVIGTSVTTADVHLEVLVDDLCHRQAEEVELPVVMVEDVRGQRSKFHQKSPTGSRAAAKTSSEQKQTHDDPRTQTDRSQPPQKQMTRDLHVCIWRARIRIDSAQRSAPSFNKKGPQGAEQQPKLNTHDDQHTN